MAIPTPLTLKNEPKIEKVYDFNHGRDLMFTSEALNYIRSFMSENAPQVQGQLFRVFVEGGGCSGMQYGFTFDAPQEGDVTHSFNDVTVLVHPDSLQFIKGAIVDYVIEARGAGFVVKNPISKGECGCGISFAV